MSYPKKYTDEVILAACDEWDARPTYKKLARKYGIKPGDVNYLINILGRKVREKYKHGYSQASQISNGMFHVDQLEDGCSRSQP